MKLLLVRHGQSLANLAWELGEPIDHVDQPLSELGHVQAEALASAFADGLLPIPNRLLSSLMVRAVQTAAPLAEACELEVEGRLDLFETGGVFRYGPRAERVREAIPGSGAAELRLLCPHLLLPSTLGDEGWYDRDLEPWVESWRRAQALVGELVDEYRDTDEVIALVTHGLFTSLMIRVLLGWEPDLQADRFQPYFINNNTGTTLVTIPGDEDDAVWLQWLNRTDHLRPDQMSY
ncbi:MAG: phosphoglycerate mutase family protein [Propionibacteriaceae bacterium]|jgi:2,3-bisphosphoglycerate-dependent phosphoglycerate mutase|nr:phosphoglycerate mutase family protein [Propionibacteriaceae bacterium]